HFLSPMVCLRSELSRTPFAIPVVLVYRGATFANSDCAYHPHPENPVYSEQSSCARTPPGRCDHDSRSCNSLHSIRCEHRPAASSQDVLSLVGRDVAKLQCRHAVSKSLVSSAVQDMVIAETEA